VPKRPHVKETHVGLILGITAFIAESTRELAMDPDAGLDRLGHFPLHFREAATPRMGLASLTSVRP
jgi:hypothetical protein